MYRIVNIELFRCIDVYRISQLVTYLFTLLQVDHRIEDRQGTELEFIYSCIISGEMLGLPWYIYHQGRTCGNFPLIIPFLQGTSQPKSRRFKSSDLRLQIL
jgi:hypothetical protein